MFPVQEPHTTPVQEPHTTPVQQPQTTPVQQPHSTPGQLQIHPRSVPLYMCDHVCHDGKLHKIII
jgi:hypothetical protein